MDEGDPIAYTVLERNVPVYASDGTEVGKVRRVVAAPEKDIFHGIVITTGPMRHSFAAADQVASLHEHGVDLRIDAAEAAQLPAPAGAEQVFEDDVLDQTKWSHLVRKVTLRKDWHRER